MRGRSGCPGVGLGPLLAAPNGHRASTGRRGWWGWPGALSSGFGVRGSGFWASGLASTSGFSAARRCGGEVGPNVDPVPDAFKVGRRNQPRSFEFGPLSAAGPEEAN